MNAPTALKNLLPVSGVQQGTDVVHESAHLHVTGSATYIDDIPEHAGTLYAALILSPVAHGELIGDGIDREAILKEHGVVAVYTATLPTARLSSWAKPWPWSWRVTCSMPAKLRKKPKCW
jgi:xanthine dehydrogenase large subunit